MSITGRMRALGARPLLLGSALLGIVVVSALAVRESMRNADERRAQAERTVRDYAKFASYLYATRGYLFALGRVNVSFAAFHLDQPYTRSELPPPTVIPAIPDTTERCGPASQWPIYRFRLDIPSGQVQYVGGRPDPVVDAIIRDSLPKVASEPWVMRAGFGYLFVEPPGGRETIAYARTRDSAGKLLAVYGYRSCYGVRDTSDYSLMYKVVRVLPPMVPGYSQGASAGSTGPQSPSRASTTNSARAEVMTGRWPTGMPADSLLTLTIVDDQRRTIFQAPRKGPSSDLYGVSPLGYVGGTTFYVNLRPDVARFLVAGGIPESHFPAALLLLAGSIILAITGFADLKALLFEIVTQHRDERDLVFHDQDERLYHCGSGIMTSRLDTSPFGRTSSSGVPFTR